MFVKAVHIHRGCRSRVHVHVKQVSLVVLYLACSLLMSLFLLGIQLECLEHLAPGLLTFLKDSCVYDVCHNTSGNPECLYAEWLASLCVEQFGFDVDWRPSFAGGKCGRFGGRGRWLSCMEAQSEMGKGVDGEPSKYIGNNIRIFVERSGKMGHTCKGVRNLCYSIHFVSILWTHVFGSIADICLFWEMQLYVLDCVSVIRESIK